jgi:hypothetical protein
MGRNYPVKEPVTVQTVSNESYKTTLQSLEQKLRQISETDFAEYRRLKDRKAQYEKAEEILAKIMQIFVADLGLRMAGFEAGKTAKQEPKPAAPEPAAPAPPPTKKKPEPPPVVAAPPASGPPDWKSMESRLKDLQSENEVDGFLKSVKVDNLFPTISNFRAAMRKDLDALAGSYTGHIRFADSSERPRDVQLKVSLNPINDLAEGEYKIIISKDGVEEENSTGKGNFGDAFSAGQSASILIRMSNNYAQLYWSPQMGQLFGNYYKKDAPDKYSPAGVVFLRRQ